MFANHLLANPELRAFVSDHNIDPFASAKTWAWDYEEDIVSVDPFRARFTFTIEADTLTLTVDDDLSVVDVTRASWS